MKRPWANMEVRLIVAVAVAIAIACGVGPYLFSRHHYNDLLESFRSTTRVQAEVIRAALEHQMLENERELIARMVKTFARDPNIDQVRILDRTGTVRFSSAGDVGARWASTSPTCRACHDRPPKDRAESTVIETERGAILRRVVPIPNQPDCQGGGCHAREHLINGVLMVDVRAGAIRAALDRDLRWMTIVTGIIALALLGAIGLALRVLVLRRLNRFEAAARAMASGDLSQRLPETGSDTLGHMAREFNAMAGSVAHLAGQLTEQRERLEMVINSVDDGIVVLDPELQVMAANGAFLARARVTRAGLLGTSCFHVGRGCSRETCAARRCFASGERQTAVLTRVDDSGDTRYEELHASPIRSGAAVVSVVEVWRDITERRKAEARMAGSHRMASLGMLASGFSHELNTPLATVLTCVEAIARTLEPERAPSGEERETALGTARIAREQVLRCRTITQQFLRLSRGQAAAAELIALESVAASVARLVEPTARDRRVIVRTHVEGRHATVRANELELQQVVMNLVLNAVQACPPGAQVDVDVLPDAGPRIRVRDQGCGIAPDELGRVFEPFYSLRPGGTGLGLFLAQDLARRWGATIEAASVVGAGSTFDVVFAERS